MTSFSSYDLDAVIVSFSETNTHACSVVRKCIRNIENGAAHSDTRPLLQQMCDVFTELVVLDAKLRLALAYSMAERVGARCLLPIDTDGDRLALAVKAEQDIAAHNQDAFATEYQSRLPKPVPESEPIPLMEKLKRSLEGLEDFQRALDEREFHILDGDSVGGFHWAMSTLDGVMEFARIRP